MRYTNRRILYLLYSCDVKLALFPGFEFCYPDVVVERTAVYSSHRVFCQMDVGFLSLISVVFVLVEYAI